MKKVKYLIVGQGIAGSLLAVELIRSGSEVHVINYETENTSSNKAAGIYNPITGRKMVKTWLADSLFPNLEPYYKQLELELEAKFLHSKTIYRPFYSNEELNDWAGKAAELSYKPYIKEICTSPSGIVGVQDPYGGLFLNYSGYVDIPTLTISIRKALIDKGSYTNELFDFEQLKINSQVSYKDFGADHVLFCDGPRVGENPYWNYLPFRPVKGEILEIDTSLPTDTIVNRGVFVLPKKGHFSVGSTYDHDNLDYVPSMKGIKNLKDRLRKLYQGDYTVVSESAGVRPATFDRRPFIGSHPNQHRVGLFNGFGTKGVSLVPYFAGQYVNYLKRGGELLAEVDVIRVKI
mgnify:CR=1 FL=1